MWIKDNKRYYGALPKTDINGITYGRDLTVEELAGLGITEVADPVRQDDKWYYNTETDDAPYIVSTLKPIEALKATKLQDLANLRYEKETGGVVIAGAKVQTDRVAQAQITGALNAFNNNFITNVQWKTEAGFIALDKAAVTGIAQAVSNHVQACFTNEATHSAAISALTDAQSVIDYDITVGWA